MLVKGVKIEVKLIGTGTKNSNIEEDRLILSSSSSTQNSNEIFLSRENSSENLRKSNSIQSSSFLGNSQQVHPFKTKNRCKKH